MVRIKSPLMSQKASGTIGGILTFSDRKTGSQVRYQKKQKDKITLSRTTQRDLFNQAIGAWNLLNSAEKKSWNVRAKGQNLTGYNLYISIFIGENIKIDSYYGVAIYGDTIYGSV